jgi:pimeloyl-ACP methyl ester carboxylesterase
MTRTPVGWKGSPAPTDSGCGGSSRVEVIDDSGHAMAADQPERTWAAVSEFLAG